MKHPYKLYKGREKKTLGAKRRQRPTLERPHITTYGTIQRTIKDNKRFVLTHRGSKGRSRVSEQKDDSEKLHDGHKRKGERNS